MTTQQKLFNLFVENNYNQLLQQLPQQDMLHSAYVTVFHIKRPMLPTCDNFKRLMSDAYYRHILREFNHSMHFILPDPLFWMYIDENNIDDEPDTETPNEEPNQDKGQQKDGATNSNSEQENENFSKIISYLRSKYNPEEVIIFNLAVLKQQTCVQIAEVTGWKKKDVRNLLNRMERDIKDMLKKK